VFLAQWMSRVMQFFRIVREDIAFVGRQLSAPERQTDQPFAHAHKIFYFRPHIRQSTGPGFYIGTGYNPSTAISSLPFKVGS